VRALGLGVAELVRRDLRRFLEELQVDLLNDVLVPTAVADERARMSEEDALVALDERRQGVAIAALKRGEQSSVGSLIHGCAWTGGTTPAVEFLGETANGRQLVGLSGSGNPARASNHDDFRRQRARSTAVRARFGGRAERPPESGAIGQDPIRDPLSGAPAALTPRHSFLEMTIERRFPSGWEPAARGA